MMMSKRRATKRSSWMLVTSRIIFQDLEHLRRGDEQNAMCLKDICNKNIVFAEEDNIHVLHVIDSSGTGRMGVVQISSRVVSENCRRLVFATRGVLIGDSGQVRVNQEQFSTSEFRQTLASAASLVHCERSAVRTVKRSLWHMKRWSKWRSSTTRIFPTCVKN